MSNEFLWKVIYNMTELGTILALCSKPHFIDWETEVEETYPSLDKTSQSLIRNKEDGSTGLQFRALSGEQNNTKVHFCKIKYI